MFSNPYTVVLNPKNLRYKPQVGNRNKSAGKTYSQTFFVNGAPPKDRCINPENREEEFDDFEKEQKSTAHSSLLMSRSSKGFFRSTERPIEWTDEQIFNMKMPYSSNITFKEPLKGGPSTAVGTLPRSRTNLRNFMSTSSVIIPNLKDDSINVLVSPESTFIDKEHPKLNIA